MIYNAINPVFYTFRLILVAHKKGTPASLPARAGALQAVADPQGGCPGAPGGTPPPEGRFPFCG